MFTGIVTAVGTLAALEPSGGDAVARVHAPALGLGDVAIGDSIAVNGVCLTATAVDGEYFSADVSAETLAHTTLGGLSVGAPLNLEKALTPDSRLGGHIVTGHVDGTVTVVDVVADGRSQRIRLSLPVALARYAAVRGSIVLDGISLTVVDLDSQTFTVNVVPHTAQATVAGDWRPGRQVNVEVDIMARYTERLLGAGNTPEPAGVTRELLIERGFIR